MLDNRLMGLTLTDNRGFERTSLIWSWTTPMEKSCCRAWCGHYAGAGLEGAAAFPERGFTVDEIEHTGAPDRLTIRAQVLIFVKH